jgi:hypothetical protein
MTSKGGLLQFAQDNGQESGAVDEDHSLFKSSMISRRAWIKNGHSLNLVNKLLCRRLAGGNCLGRNIPPPWLSHACFAGALLDRLLDRIL